MADVKFLANIDLNDNQLLNMKLQHLSSDPTGVEGQLFYHSGTNVVKYYDGSNWIAFGTSTADGDITGVTAGSGMTGGGASGGVTLNVIGGNGITANADDVAITAAQTTITSVLNTALVLGRDADNQIKFATDNTMVFRVGAGDGVTFKASGEIEATKFDGALEGNADTATTLANARTIGGVSFNGSANINLPGVNSAGNQNTSGVAATATILATARNIGGVSFNGSANIDLPGVNSAGNQNTSGTAAAATLAAAATTVTLTDESSDTTCFPVFAQSATGNIALETGSNLLFNSSSGMLTATGVTATFTGDLTGDVTGDVSGSSGSTTGNAATATKISSITNSNIVQLTASQTLTNKTIAASQVTEISNLTTGEGAQLENIGSTTISATQWGYLGAASGAITNTDVSVSSQNLKTTLGDGFPSDEVNIGDSGDTVTIPGDLVISGDLNVTGDTVTTNTTSLTVKDPLIVIANNNAADVLDTGFYSQYSANSATRFTGIFRDASGDGDPYTFFDNLTAEPGTTVNTAHESYDLAPITAGVIKSVDGFQGNLTGNVTGNTSGSSGSCTGLAATATALATARTIGGVSFNGTANINLPGVNSAGNQNTSGSAATLTTARTIGGVSFDGSANINLAGVNSAGNQNTTGSAATLTTSRNINGVAFNGSANITVTAAAGTLSGSTLKSSVTASSLTSVGTLSSGNTTATVSDASESVKGKVELATTAEALAGTDTARAVTAAGLAARSFKATIGDGSDLDIAVTHNLGTRDVVVQLYDASDYKTIYAEVVRTDANNVTINTNTAIASNDCIVLITKID